MTELLHWIAHLICAFLGVAGVIYIDDLKKQLNWAKQHRGAHSNDTRQFVIPEELAKAHEKKAKRVRKGKGKVELVKG